MKANRTTEEPAGSGGGGAVSRRGRPRSGEREQRRRRILDAALEEMVANGYERVTMLGIASRAGASKETLYGWFGSREGLFAELIRDVADTSAERVQAALDNDADPRETLINYAAGLLTLLTTPSSIMLNRAAMSAPALAEVLLASGRHRVGPIVERYLAELANDGYLDITDPADAFELLYGLIIQDTQIRVLLGEPPPSPAQTNTRAKTAIDRFLALTTNR